MNRRLFALALVAGTLPAQPPVMFSPVRGTREMVAAANNFQVEAGFRVLSQGGNAVDAGVAAVLTATVTEQSRVGLGGEMPLLVRMEGKTPVAISGIGWAPKKATVAYFTTRAAEPWEEGRAFPPIPAQGLRSAITPGLFDGLILALSQHGTRSFAEVAAPAIEYADGFPIGEEYASFIRSMQRILQLWPPSAEFFLPGGQAPERGSIFRSPTLAATLRELAAVEKKAKGNRAAKLKAVRDYFYKGALAKRVGQFSEANAGLIGYEDMAAFHAESDTPRSTTFRGYEIHKPGFWTQGPVMLQALNLLEGYDLKKMGHNSAEYLHTVIEAVKLAFADRDRYYGDPKFSKIPEDTLLSRSYAAERRKLIEPGRASLESRPGHIPGAPGATPTQSASNVEAHDTTCVNVVDRWGNAFSATPSGAWLPSVIAGPTGIPFSTRLQSFVMTEGHPNQLAPNKRPRVTLSPTLVTRDGKLAFIMSTPGGDNQDQAMLQVLLNIIEFGMTPQEAVEAPRFQSEHYYSSFAGHEFTPGRVNLEQKIGRGAADKLAGWGHTVRVTGDWTNSSAPTVILKAADGVLHGGADPRRSRFVFGR